MRKIWNIIIVLMLMVSIAPLAFADEAEDLTDEVKINDETQKQVEIMNVSLGSEIRLLQLEKSITKNIIKGEEVVSILKDLGYNTTYLEVILAEFEFLKGEVIDADPNSTDAVQIFVDLKHDAVNLTKDFRDALVELLDEDTIEQLRGRIREMICEQVQNLSSKIQNKIKQYNRNQLHKLYQIMGENGNSFLNKYQNGNLTMEQVKQQVGKMVNQMTKEKRYEIFSQLKQNNIQKKIQAKVCVQNATAGFQTREESRLKNRLQKSENMPNDPINEEMQERIRNRLKGNDNAGTDGSGNNADNGGPGNGNNQQPGGGGN